MSSTSRANARAEPRTKARRGGVPAGPRRTEPGRPRPRSPRRSTPRPNGSRASPRCSAAAPLAGVGAGWPFGLTRRRAAKLTHRNALARLKSLGFAPAVIYDIGAYRGGWTKVAAEVFPQARFVLFEANSDHAVELAAGRHEFFIAPL